MQRSTLASKRDDEEYSFRQYYDDSTCDECGETFQKPILATITSDGSNQEYYACPRCLTKVSDTKTREKQEKEENKETPRDFAIRETSRTESECQHFLGYLKKRSKDIPIPDTCLTCSRMVECLYIK